MTSQASQASEPFKAKIRDVSHPIVDISGYIENDKEKMKQIGLDLRIICEMWGFFHATRHGIDPELKTGERLLQGPN